VKSLLIFIVLLCSFSIVFASENVQEITVSGIGASIDEAIKNGLNHAVIQAVGSILKSEITLSSTSMTDNEQMTFEEAYYENIAIYTKGFIEDYEVVDMSQEEGLWTVELCVLVNYEPLKDYINQSELTILELDGEKIARIIEVNQEQNADFDALVKQIVGQMDFLKSGFQVNHLSFEIASYANDYVELNVDAELGQREDYLEFFTNNFNDVFSNIEHQLGKKSIQSQKSLNSLVIYFSEIEQLDGYSPVIHVLSKVEETRLLFESYYLQEEDVNTTLFNKQLSEIIKNQVCSISVQFLDEAGRIIHKSEEKMVSNQGNFLSPQTLGAAYTNQQGGHFFFCPAILTIQSGSMKLNFEPLRFSWKIRIKTEDFLNIKNLELIIQ